MKEFLRTGKWCLATFFMICFTSFLGQAQAQQKSVTGTVKDGPSGDLLPGVSIVVQGTSQGTITDVNGAFSIDVPSDDAVLVFSFVGYSRTEVRVTGKTSVEVSLTPDLTTVHKRKVLLPGRSRRSTLPI
jgi:hypothetical protein